MDWNANHPRRGRLITVEPIRDRKATATIKRLLAFGVDIPTRMPLFGRATQPQTLASLGIQPDEIRSVGDNEL